MNSHLSCSSTSLFSFLSKVPRSNLVTHKDALSTHDEKATAAREVPANKVTQSDEEIRTDKSSKSRLPSSLQGLLD